MSVSTSRCSRIKWSRHPRNSRTMLGIHVTVVFGFVPEVIELDTSIFHFFACPIRLARACPATLLNPPTGHSACRVSDTVCSIDIKQDKAPKARHRCTFRALRFYFLEVLVISHGCHLQPNPNLGRLKAPISVTLRLITKGC